jgi:membrane protein DedA with SNARE-associated domain
MEFLATPEAGLLGLFLSSFLAATLLPGGSEVVLFALVKLHPEQATTALVIATIGNTLGGLTTYGMARLLPERKLPEKSAVVVRHGAPAVAALRALDGAGQGPALRRGAGRRQLVTQASRSGAGRCTA